MNDIKLLAMDVDGVMTDCKLYIAPDGTEFKTFNVKDGYGIKALSRAGIKSAIISGRNSKAVDIRAAELGIDYVFQGVSDKIACFEQILAELSITAEQAAYIGDDTPDLPLLNLVKLSAAPADAHISVLNAVDVITQRNGGEGAVRDFCDVILRLGN